MALNINQMILHLFRCRMYVSFERRAPIGRIIVASQ
jgi:hypothetical protein